MTGFPPRGSRQPDGPPTMLTLTAGDALLMHPRLAHAGTLNRGPTIRTAVYFRLVAGARLR